MVRRDSFSILRDTMRWRVALVLGSLVMLLMLALATVNSRLGYLDNANLSWVVFGVSGASVIGLLFLPRRLGGTVFFTTVAALLIFVPWFGLQHGRNMQHWAYIFPPMLVFLLRAGPALAAMIAYGLMITWITSLLVPVIEVVRFGSGYGLMVCFMYTYALLQERAATMLRYHSDHDALSNCLNRRTFNEALEQLGRAATKRTQCTFLLLDIDHFKSINDQHGHLVGDRIITQVAAELGRVLDPGTPLFRYGGEEFSIMLVDVAESVGIELAERLRLAVERADFQGVRVTVSIGVAEWRASTGKVEATLGRADRALYHAKRAGRNRVAGATALELAA
ncbi:MAG: GGDEF domain-containing protein [Tahibacter sp.]